MKTKRNETKRKKKQTHKISIGLDESKERE